MKVAILTGELPTTVFIDRLITGLETNHVDILLVGRIKRPVLYESNRIKIIGFKNTIQQLLLFVRYWFLLQVSKRQEKKKLDQILRNRNQNQWSKKAFYYPVLYHKPDILHVQWAKSIGDWMWVKEFKIKLVLSLRGAHINYSPIFSTSLADVYRNCFPNIDGFHSVSEDIALEAQKYGAPQERIKTVYSGLPLEKLLYKSKEKLSSPLQIFSIGRNHWIKSYTTALDAMSLLQKRGVLFEYHLIGVEPDEELLFQYYDLGLAGCVFFHPAVSFDKVKESIYQADILLLPSIKEGLANVALEAMALGTLVVSTHSGGMKEAIQNGQTGFLVDPLEPESIIDKILHVMDLSIEEYLKITQAARFQIETKCHEQQMVDGMLDLYQNIVSS